MARLIELYDAGLSLREIERETGVPNTTARHRLLLAGVEMRGRGGNRREPPHEDYARTAFLYERMGLSVNEIAQELGISHSSVCNRLVQHGVTMRSRSESAKMRFARRPRSKAA